MSTEVQHEVVFDPTILASPDARRRFLRDLAIAAGAVAAAPLIMKGWGITELLAQDVSGETEPGLSDQDILNYALTLEYLEATFYLRSDNTLPLPMGATIEQIDPDGGGAPGTVPGLSSITPPAPATFDVVTFNRAVRDHEIIHVLTLQGALGAAALARTDFAFSFPGAFDSASAFLATAVALEDTGVSAYLGQAGNVDDTAILTTAGRILGVEAEHASTFRLLVGEPVSPGNANFDDGRTSAEVLAIADDFITAAPPLPFP
ncbi:MAG: ferritin-like domain-containing protein [Gemmatimonadota bacterium]